MKRKRIDVVVRVAAVQRSSSRSARSDALELLRSDLCQRFREVISTSNFSSRSRVVRSSAPSVAPPRNHTRTEERSVTLPIARSASRDLGLERGVAMAIL